MRYIKHVGAALASAALVIAGAQAAQAGNTVVDVREGMAHVTGAINWKYAYQRDGNKWQVRLSGRLYNDGNDHVYVQTAVERGGYGTNAEKQGKGSSSLDARHWPGDTLQVGFMRVKACESAWGPDRCDVKTYDNPNT